MFLLFLFIYIYLQSTFFFSAIIGPFHSRKTAHVKKKATMPLLPYLYIQVFFYLVCGKFLRSNYSFLQNKSNISNISTKLNYFTFCKKLFTFCAFINGCHVILFDCRMTIKISSFSLLAIFEFVCFFLSNMFYRHISVLC